MDASICDFIKTEERTNTVCPFPGNADSLPEKDVGKDIFQHSENGFQKDLSYSEKEIETGIVGGDVRISFPTESSDSKERGKRLWPGIGTPLPREKAAGG